ncbi:MAG: imidazolonepropionase [Roseivirga sp.]|nr:imidazolonepropionase [Roseivirga sp.]
MKKLFTHIGQLVQVRPTSNNLLRGAMMRDLPVLKDMWLLTEDGRIADWGEMDTVDEVTADESVSLNGAMVMPTFVDSHTHLVYAADRDEEFVMKIKGIDYQTIAESGGGILNSARKLQQVSEEELFESASKRLEEVIRQGTGAIEIKSGYGLTTEAEVKILRVIAKLKDRFAIPIKSTFLGAHAFPYADQEKYIKSIIHEMLPQIYSEGLADYIDVFCEEGYYSKEQMCQILEAGDKYELKPKVHVNQFNSIGGIEAAIENGALSVDHLEVLSEDEIALLKDSDTIPVALPGCSFFLNIDFTPGRKIIESGLPLVLASDFNPGSSPSYSMSMINALACIKMKLLPEEAINATTYNAAFALELGSEVGSITKGKLANFIVAKPGTNPYSIAYHFGVEWIDSVYINGDKY